MSFQIELPTDITSTPFDLKMLFAAKLFEEGIVSSGQGAKMVGISRRAFIELLGQYGVSAFQTEVNELLEDIANA